MSALVTLTNNLSQRLGMGDSQGLIETLKSTAFRGQEVNDSQMIALMVVAQQYGLNPWVREIYAFPDKGGIVPVVGVDGWARIINSDPNFDGIEFEQDDEKCTCIISRKDRSKVTKVTEYLSECRRNTQPWQSHPKRMLRHKAMIQCARLAFGFVGIVDPDDAERIAENSSAQAQPTTIDASTGEVIEQKRQTYSQEAFNKNKQAWRDLVIAGKRTTKQIITTISAKAELTEDQLVEIDSWNHEQE